MNVEKLFLALGGLLLIYAIFAAIVAVLQACLQSSLVPLYTTGLSAVAAFAMFVGAVKIAESLR